MAVTPHFKRVEFDELGVQGSLSPILDQFEYGRKSMLE